MNLWSYTLGPCAGGHERGLPRNPGLVGQLSLTYALAALLMKALSTPVPEQYWTTAPVYKAEGFSHLDNCGHSKSCRIQVPGSPQNRYLLETFEMDRASASRGTDSAFGGVAISLSMDAFRAGVMFRNA